MSETKAPRPRNVLIAEFEGLSKEDASQALRDAGGDLDRARALVRRRRERPDDTDDDEPAVKAEEPPPPPDDEDEEESDDDDDDDEDDDDDDDYDFDEWRNNPYGKKPKAKKSKKLSDEEKARRKEERDRKREEKKREAQREKDKWAQNRQSLLEGREAKSTLASYAGKSSYLHSVGDRPNFADAKLLYVKSIKMEENDYGEKYKRLHTFAIGNDIIQWWASTSNKEAKLIGDAGCVVDFAGSISKHSEYDDCQITTVMRLKVHVVDGVRVAPTPKEKKKTGRKLGDDDESDVKPSPSKKPRVAGGAARQKSMDKELLRDDGVDVDDENKDIVDGNDWLKQLARQRAERRK
jgi:hypothetical protein